MKTKPTREETKSVVKQEKADSKAVTVAEDYDDVIVVDSDEEDVHILQPEQSKKSTTDDVKAVAKGFLQKFFFQI